MQIITAEVYAELPPEFHWKGPPTDWVKGRPWGLPPAFFEGPGFDREGFLYFVDIPYGRIFRLSPDRQWEIFVQYDGEPNGLRIHRDGRIFIADHKRGIMAIDPVTRKVEPVLTSFEGKPLRGPNDLVFRDTGDIYFTDMGNSDLADPYGRLMRLSPDGKAEVVLDRLAAPNGLAITRDNATLYLNMFRMNAVWQMRFTPEGGVSRVAHFIQLSGGLGPDGLLLDDADNLVIAHGGLGVIWVYSALGEPMLRINCPRGKMVTNIAFSVTEPDRLFMTDSSCSVILTVKLPLRGRLPFSHRPAPV